MNRDHAAATYGDRLHAWAHRLKRDVVALWLAARDPRVPRPAKLLAGAVAAYALSPIDLIPDFIPILGYLDDLVVIPLGVWLAIRLIPSPLMTELRASAEGRERPSGLYGAVAITLLWITATAAAVWCVLPARQIP